MKATRLKLIIVLLTTYLLASASDTQGTEASHSKKATPNIEKVFTNQNLIRIDVDISSENWNTLLNHADTLMGNRNERPAPMKGNTPRPPLDHAKGVHPGPGQMGMPGPPPMRQDSLGHKKMGGPIPKRNETEKKAPWIDCNIRFDGQVWEHTGIRVKGNSSFMAAHHSASKKYSFKLDFDQFEEQYPQTKNQRFWGFKQLNLNNNSKDASLMHEKVASDLMREFDIASAHTVFCALYLNMEGESKFYGIYTLVEEVDNTVIKTQFKDNSGNLYKPDGIAGSLNTASFNEHDMFLKTNKKGADYADVKALVKVINDETRTTEPTAWKTSLASIFDIPVFLKWLAVKQTIQNWDAYGQIGHNYYLYNNPENNKLTWIPWDHNEALCNARTIDRIDYSNVNEQWPLIKNILEVPEHYELYLSYLEDFNQNMFTKNKMEKLYQSYYETLMPYIELEADLGFFISSKEDFQAAYAELKEHTLIRQQTIRGYLETKNGNEDTAQQHN